MKLVGVTGGVGMGKTTARSILLRRGVAVIDTDQIARDLVQPGLPALKEIQARFGNEFIDGEGKLKRGELADLVFEDNAAREQLEVILHPPIRTRWMTQVADWRQRGTRLGAVVIPLLFETDAENRFDAVVCVACSSQNQITRLRERGWSEQQIRQRIASQWPLEQKMAKSDYVVWTDGELDVHAEQWERIISSVCDK